VEAARLELYVHRLYGMPGKYATVELILEERGTGAVVTLREYGYHDTLQGRA
jgi:hypothetical protein